MMNIDTLNSSLRTLCIVQKEEKVLLGLKKRGFGAGKWNGFGGKLQPGESLVAAAARELQEEAGIIGKGFAERGVLDFTFGNGTLPLQVHIFMVESFTGNVQETEEMRPQWFAFSDIPYSEMWADDPHWLPAVLAGDRVRGTFHFTDEATLATHDVQITKVAAKAASRH